MRRQCRSQQRVRKEAAGGVQQEGRRAGSRGPSSTLATTLPHPGHLAVQRTCTLLSAQQVLAVAMLQQSGRTCQLCSRLSSSRRRLPKAAAAGQVSLGRGPESLTRQPTSSAGTGSCCSSSRAAVVLTGSQQAVGQHQHRALRGQWAATQAVPAQILKGAAGQQAL